MINPHYGVKCAENIELLRCMMRLRIVLVVGILLGSVCCQNSVNDDYRSDGMIIGPDIRMCICCGGWQIVIDKETYNFDLLPSASDIDLQKVTFPVFVRVDWELKGNSGCQKWIIIQRIKKV
jgi:hypothetical protein